MKRIVLFSFFSLIALAGYCQQGDKNGVGKKSNETKVPEQKLATDPVENNGKNQPELKMTDRSTADPEKVAKMQSGTPELKLISKPQ